MEATERNNEREKSKCLTAFFTGHRKLSPQEVSFASSELEAIMRRLITQHNVGVFRAGGALGFDTLAAFSTLGLKREFPHIRLELFLSCPNQTRWWKDEDVAVYDRIMEMADGVNFVSPTYFGGCMQLRDRRMAENSDLGIAFLRRGVTEGGTRYTVGFARSIGIKVYNLTYPEVWRKELFETK